MATVGMYENSNSEPLDNPDKVNAPKDGGVKDSQTVKMVMDLYDQGKKARNKYDKNWGMYRKFYDGDQWDNSRPAYRASPVANITYSTIQTILPIMTDAQPGFNIGPREPSDYQFADWISKLIAEWWPRVGMDLKLVNTIMDSLIVDVGFMKVIWDFEAEDGSGEVICSVLDPESVYVDPKARDCNENCGWIVHEMHKPLGVIKRMFPDKAEEIKATSSSNDKEKEDDTYQGDVVLVSPIDKKSRVYSKGGATEGLSDNQEVRILEIWMDDYATEDFEEENEDGIIEKKQKYKYPDGRVVKVLPDQRIVLEDKSNPYKDGKKPFIRFIDTVRPREFYGQGEVEPLIPIQKQINKALANIIDYMSLMSNPVWIIDTTSGIQPSDITNQVGLILTKTPGSEVRRESPRPMPSHFMQLYDVYMNLADQISGAHDVTQGRKPAGVTAAEAISELQEAAQTRIRLKERNLQNSLNQLGNMVVSRMIQYYREPRIIKITGSDNWPNADFFEFQLRDIELESGLAGVQPVTQTKKFNPVTGGYPVGDNYEEGNPSKGLFDIEVMTGTALPFAKDKRGQLARQLFRDGVIDDVELLKVLEWPRQEEVLRRMKEKLELEAQAAAGAGGGMPPAM